MKKKSAEAKVEEILVNEILNGKYAPFSLLSPERVLAESLGYSRPVIHKALIRLESKGLVTILPRKGIRVNDYRESGKLGLLESIYDLYHGGISRSLNQSMLIFIQNNLESIIMQIIIGDVENKTECFVKQCEKKMTQGSDVFNWIQTFALYCGNPIYPMLINEFEIGILNVSNAVLYNANLSNFEEKLGAVTHLLSLDANHPQNTLESLRTLIANSVESLFSFIEKYWLTEGDKNEV